MIEHPRLTAVQQSLSEENREITESLGGVSKTSADLAAAAMLAKRGIANDGSLELWAKEQALTWVQMGNVPLAAATVISAAYLDAFMVGYDFRKEQEQDQ